MDKGCRGLAAQLGDSRLGSRRAAACAATHQKSARALQAHPIALTEPTERRPSPAFSRESRCRRWRRAQREKGGPATALSEMLQPSLPALSRIDETVVARKAGRLGYTE